MPSGHRLSLYFAGIGREVVFIKPLYSSSATWAILLSFPEQGNFSELAMNDPFTLASGILDAWAWCTGMTQRDGVGREEGGGFKMGSTCIPVADSF